MTALRLDKWLWAARFFKTRKLAKQAISSGKIRINGIKPKPSRMVKIHALIEIKRGWHLQKIEVLAINKQRRSAPEAQKLYQETEESIQAREKQRQLYQTNVLTMPKTKGKPTKKERRQMTKYKR